MIPLIWKLRHHLDILGSLSSKSSGKEGLSYKDWVIDPDNQEKVGLRFLSGNKEDHVEYRQSPEVPLSIPMPWDSGQWQAITTQPRQDSNSPDPLGVTAWSLHQIKTHNQLRRMLRAKEIHSEN